MPRPGLFDTTAVPAGLFDMCGQDQGWFDRDLLFIPSAPPPPPPPPPAPRPLRPSGAGGGFTAETLGPYVPPAWLPQWILRDECEEICPEDQTADFALIHIAPPEPIGAAVKALADGVVETSVDSRGRSSLVLTGDDGTRYWYADVGQQLADDGERVRSGQVIARTKPGAPSIPTITPRGDRPMLLAAGEAEPMRLEPKPAQVVFVDPPPMPACVAPFAEPLPPVPLPTPPTRRWVKLVPIGEPPPAPPSVDTIRVPDRPRSTIVRVVVPAAVFATILYLLASFEPPRRRRR